MTTIDAIAAIVKHLPNKHGQKKHGDAEFFQPFGVLDRDVPRQDSDAARKGIARGDRVTAQYRSVNQSKRIRGLVAGFNLNDVIVQTSDGVVYYVDGKNVFKR